MGLWASLERSFTDWKTYAISLLVPFLQFLWRITQELLRDRAAGIANKEIDTALREGGGGLLETLQDPSFWNVTLLLFLASLLAVLGIRVAWAAWGADWWQHGSTKKLQREITSLRDRLDQTENELKEKGRLLQWTRRGYGLYRIKMLGYEQNPTNPSVHVQYVLEGDRTLAESIRKLFWGEDGISEYSPWKTGSVEHVPSTDNPSDRARIVMFSDHENTERVKAAIRYTELLEEPIWGHERRQGQEADILIVIFDNKRSEWD